MKLELICHFKGIFNVNVSRPHCDTIPTDRTERLKPVMPKSVQNLI